MLIEAILDLLFDGSVEIAKNKKISKKIRYPLIGLVILFVSLAIGLILYIGISMLLSGEKNEQYIGIVITLLGFGFLLMIIRYTIKEKDESMQIKYKNEILC